MAKVKYTLEQKMEAAQAYLICGTATKASDLCGVPDRTIRDWTTQEWWADMLDAADKRTNHEIMANQTRLMKQTNEQLEKRLKEGDPIVVKGDVVGYKPIAARDLAIIHAVMVDKRAAVRGVKETVKASKTIDERLDNMAAKLAEWESKKKENPNSPEQNLAEIQDKIEETKSFH